MILQEFDNEKNAVINPEMIYKRVPDFPETVVAVFSHYLFDRLVKVLDGKQIAELRDVDGNHPVYSVTYKGKKLAFAKARGGGASCVGTYEDVIAFGAKRIILTGNCGVLDKSIEDCGIIIPNRAIRDEGTSYHYAPAADFIDVNVRYADVFKKICDERGYKYVEGTTWTTDAFYRETPEKVARRKKMGAICVEMECASMQAMCNFRGVEMFEYFYAGDNLDSDKWQPRSLSGKVRLDKKEKIVLLAFELAAEIS